MDKTLQYTQDRPNFDSAYNILPNRTPQSTMYIPISSSATFSTFSNRSSSPLFRRCVSPPSRPPMFTGSVPKFNFDLYKMDEYDGYSSPSHRSISPPSSRIIHHYPIHSPLSSPTSKSQTLSKLRRINDELCQTLARSESNDLPSSQPHYHIHHYPLSQHSNRKYRSRSSSEEYSPPTELEVSPKIHKARVTYKIHIPRRHRQEKHHQKSSRHISPSDVYSSDDPMTVDLYPTRDQGFVKQIRKHSDNQSPWLVDGTSIRRSSYSDTSTSRQSQTPSGPYYGDKPIKSHRRSNCGKERSSAPPRSESASSKTRERVWHPPSKTISHRPPKYFKPTLKPERDVSIRKRIVDATESEPIPQEKILSNRTKIRSGDPKFKKRIANAESKVKSAWEPSTTNLTQSIVKESKPPIPLPVKKTTSSTPSKSKMKSIPSEPTAPTTTNTDRSSLNDVPTKLVFESTPRNQNHVHENDESVEDLFENESHTSEQSKKQELPRPSPSIEKTPTPPSLPQQPRKSATELPKTTVPEPDKGTKSTIKNGVLIRGDDTKNIRNQNPTPPPPSKINDNDTDNDEEASDDHNAQPTPPPKIPIHNRKTPSIKSNNKENESVIDDDGDENDQEVAHSFDINKWLNDASKAILGPSKKNDLIHPSTPPKPPTPKSNAKSPPRRKEQPPSPPSDENLYKPPFGPKKKDQKPASPPPPPATTTGETDEVNDFFS